MCKKYVRSLLVVFPMLLMSCMAGLSPPATPDESAVQTRMAQAVAATLTALPTATQPPPPPTHTPVPPPPTVTPIPPTSTSSMTTAPTIMPTSTPTFPPMSPTPTSVPPTATLPPEPGATRVWEKDSSEMIYIPAGEFVMGLRQDGSIAYDGDEFRHTVYLDAFWIDKYETTNAQYKRCVDAGACERPFSNSSYSRVAYYDDPQFDRYPVIEVNWKGAADYCQWVGKRLPTEAEWEYAARGADERTWPWGSLFDPDKVNSWEGGAGDTTQVDWYANGASVFGVLNMAGNVAEWTADWYGSDYYHDAPVHNPQGPASGLLKVARGGSWRWSADVVRTSDRNVFSPDTHSNDVGFRCAVSADQ